MRKFENLKMKEFENEKLKNININVICVADQIYWY